MKKIAILTSFLALAACGGGSHHAGERVRVTEEPTYQQQYLLTTEQTRSSNSSVTSMVSEVAVCQNCDSPRTIESRSSIISQGDHKFKVYDLSDVKFTLADEGALEPGSEDFYFVIDDKEGSETRGKIIGINLAKKGNSWRSKDSEHPEHGQPKEVDADFVRKSDKEFFGYIKHVTEEKPNINGFTETDFTPVFMSKEKKFNLKYSDFGYFDVDIKENWHPVFIGGYDVKKVDPTKIEKDVSFSGYAVGYVAAFTDGSDNAETKSLDAAAKLTFADGHSNLVADFKNNDWYKVEYKEEYDKNGVVSDRKIKFIGDLADDTYRFSKDNFGMSDKYQEYEDRDKDPETHNTVESDIRYFGNSNKPVEAVGIIQVRDCAGGKCGNFDDPDARNNEVRMNLSFGVK